LLLDLGTVDRPTVLLGLDHHVEHAATGDYGDEVTNNLAAETGIHIHEDDWG